MGAPPDKSPGTGSPALRTFGGSSDSANLGDDVQSHAFELDEGSRSQEFEKILKQAEVKYRNGLVEWEEGFNPLVILRRYGMDEFKQHVKRGKRYKFLHRIYFSLPWNVIDVSSTTVFDGYPTNLCVLQQVVASRNDSKEKLTREIDFSLNSGRKQYGSMSNSMEEHYLVHPEMEELDDSHFLNEFAKLDQAIIHFFSSSGRYESHSASEVHMVYSRLLDAIPLHPEIVSFGEVEIRRDSFLKSKLDPLLGLLNLTLGTKVYRVDGVTTNFTDDVINCLRALTENHDRLSVGADLSDVDEAQRSSMAGPSAEFKAVNKCCAPVPLDQFRPDIELFHSIHWHEVKPVSISSTPSYIPPSDDNEVPRFFEMSDDNNTPGTVFIEVKNTLLYTLFQKEGCSPDDSTGYYTLNILDFNNLEDTASSSIGSIMREISVYLIKKHYIRAIITDTIVHLYLELNTASVVGHVVGTDMHGKKVITKETAANAGFGFHNLGAPEFKLGEIKIRPLNNESASEFSTLLNSIKEREVLDTGETPVIPCVSAPKSVSSSGQTDRSSQKTVGPSDDTVKIISFRYKVLDISTGRLLRPSQTTTRKFPLDLVGPKKVKLPINLVIAAMVLKCISMKFSRETKDIDELLDAKYAIKGLNEIIRKPSRPQPSRTSNQRNDTGNRSRSTRSTEESKQNDNQNYITNDTDEDELIRLADQFNTAIAYEYNPNTGDTSTSAISDLPSSVFEKKENQAPESGETNATIATSAPSEPVTGKEVMRTVLDDWEDLAGFSNRSKSLDQARLQPEYTEFDLRSLFNLMLYKPEFKAQDFGYNRLIAISKKHSKHVMLKSAARQFDASIVLFEVEEFIESFGLMKHTANSEMIDLMRKIPSGFLVLKVYNYKTMAQALVNQFDIPFDELFDHVEGECVSFMNDEIACLERIGVYNSQKVIDAITQHINITRDSERDGDNSSLEKILEVFNSKYRSKYQTLVERCLENIILHERLIGYGHRIKYSGRSKSDTFEGWFGIFPYIGTSEEAYYSLKEGGYHDPADDLEYEIKSEEEYYNQRRSDRYEDTSSRSDLADFENDPKAYSHVQDVHNQLVMLNDELGIIHGDICSQNILSFASRAFLIDFEWSFLFDEADYENGSGIFDKRSFQGIHPLKFDRERLKLLCD